MCEPSFCILNVQNLCYINNFVYNEKEGKYNCLGIKKTANTCISD